MKIPRRYTKEFYCKQVAMLILCCGAASYIRITGAFSEIIGTQGKAVLEHFLSGVGSPALCFFSIFVFIKIINWLDKKSISEYRKEPKFMPKLSKSLRGCLTRHGKLRSDPSIMVPISCVIYILAILYWELIHQPLISVYGDAPRGSIQPWQILGGFLGVATYYWFTNMQAAKRAHA